MKKFAFGLLLSIFVFNVAVTPTYAADGFFKRFSQSIGTRFQRLYLNVIPGKKSGKAVMNQASMESEKLQSAELNMKFDMDMQDDGRSLAKMKMNIVGPVEMKSSYDPSTYKQEFNISGEASMEGTVMKAAADVKMTPDMVYFKVNEVPALPMDLSGIKGKWLKTKNTSSSSQKKLSEEDIQKMKDAYKKLFDQAQYSDATKETKDGHSVYVLQATFPKAALKEYVKTVMEIQSKSSAGMQDFSEARFEQSMGKFFDSMSEVKATVWVDRSSFQVRHTEVPVTFTLPETGRAATPTTANPLAALSQVDKLVANIIVDLDKFNEPVNFVEPSDAVDAETAFREVMMNSSMQKSNVGTSELPELTPQQKMQLEKLEKQNKMMQNKQNGRDVTPPSFGE